MKCKDLKPLLGAYLHKELPNAQSEELREHLRRCHECQQHLDDIAAVENLMQKAIRPRDFASHKEQLLQKINKRKQEANMEIRFECQGCGKHFSASEKHSGKKLKCPKCAAMVLVPTASTLPPKGDDLFSNAKTPPAGSLKAIEEKPRRETAQRAQTQRKRQASDKQPRTSRREQNAKKISRKSPRKPQENIKSDSLSNLLIIGGVAVAGLLVVALLAMLLFSGSSDKPDPSLSAKDKAGENTAPEIKAPIVRKKPVIIDKEPERPRTTPLKIISAFPQYGMAGEDVGDIALEAEGGVPPYTWEVARGTLPDGLDIDGTKYVKGWPKTGAVGEFEFTLMVRDSVGQENTMDVKYVVDDTLELDSLHSPYDLQVGVPVNHQFKAMGGRQPYMWEVIDKLLPKGLEFNEMTHTLVGTAEEPGYYRLNLKVTDSLGRSPITANTLFEGEVKPAPEPEPEPQPEPGPEIKKDPTKPEPINPKPEPKPPVVKREPVNEQDAQRQKLLELHRQGHVLHAAKRYVEAIAIYEEILKLDDSDMTALYNIACAYSLLNKRDEALEYLERAIKAGFTSLEHIKADKDLDNISRLSGFRKLTKNQETLEELASESVMKRLQTEFPGYLIYKDDENKLIFATNIGDNDEQRQALLELLIDRIRNYALSQWKHLFKHKPNYYIKVVLPSLSDFAAYRKKNGFPNNVGGWYSPTTRFLISGTLGHTLTHEFTHALHYADMGKRGVNMNLWFIEGLATVFESSLLPERATQEAEPIDNERFNWAQQVAKTGNYYVPWRKFLTMSRNDFMGGWKDQRRMGVSYAMARYITLWLWEQKKLKKYYEAYCDTAKDDISGIAAMEKLFGKKLEEIEADWKKWMIERRPPTLDSRLGIELSSESKAAGQLIARVQEGTPAEKAGLQVGDVISEIGGLAIDSTMSLRFALSVFKPNKFVEMIVLRDGKPKKIKVKLGKLEKK